MRTIKFRAKAINREPDREYRTNYKNGDWVYGLISNLGFEEYNIPARMTNEYGVEGIDIDRNTIGQFTGIYDMNNKPIYEYDILKDDAGQLGKVFYSDKEASFLVNWKFKDGSYDTDGCLDYGRIVGNIWDNPELLNGV